MPHEPVLPIQSPRGDALERLRRRRQQAAEAGRPSALERLRGRRMLRAAPLRVPPPVPTEEPVAPDLEALAASTVVRPDVLRARPTPVREPARVPPPPTEEVHVEPKLEPATHAAWARVARQLADEGHEPSAALQFPSIRAKAFEVPGLEDIFRRFHARAGIKPTRPIREALRSAAQQHVRPGVSAVPERGAVARTLEAAGEQIGEKYRAKSAAPGAPSALPRGEREAERQVEQVRIYGEAAGRSPEQIAADIEQDIVDMSADEAKWANQLGTMLGDFVDPALLVAGVGAERAAMAGLQRMAARAAKGPARTLARKLLRLSHTPAGAALQRRLLARAAHGLVTGGPINVAAAGTLAAEEGRVPTIPELLVAGAAGTVAGPALEVGGAAVAAPFGRGAAARATARAAAGRPLTEQAAELVRAAARETNPDVAARLEAQARELYARAQGEPQVRPRRAPPETPAERRVVPERRAQPRPGALERLRRRVGGAIAGTDIEALETAATQDPRTGALNPQADRVRTEAALTERAEGERIVRYRLDMDNFKALNDERGHAAGDAALQAVKDALEQELRAEDLVTLSRVGGDEFAVTMRIAEGAEAAAIRDRLESIVNQRLTREGLGTAKGRPVEASIGFAEATDATTAEALDELADLAARARKTERAVSIPRGEEVAPKPTQAPVSPLPPNLERAVAQAEQVAPEGRRAEINRLRGELEDARRRGEIDPAQVDDFVDAIEARLAIPEEAPPPAPDERIVAAVVRIGTQEFDGRTHGEALGRAENVLGAEAVETTPHEELFRTSTGRVIERSEATAVATRAEQMTPELAAAVEAGEQVAAEGLILPGVEPPPPAPSRIAPSPGALANRATQPFESLQLDKPLGAHTAAELDALEARVTQQRAVAQAKLDEGAVGSTRPFDYDLQVLEEERASRAMAAALQTPPPDALPAAPPPERVRLGRTVEGPISVEVIQVKNADGTAVPVRYRVVNADDLLTSHDPETFARQAGYPEGIQERRYHADKVAQEEVARVAQQLDPDIVLDKTTRPTEGPGISTDDGVMLSGNQRTMAIQRAYRAGSPRAAAYREALLARAKDFGLDPEQVRALERPVLTREIVRTEALDLSDRGVLAELVARFNDVATKAKDPLADAATRARRLRDATDVLEHFGSTIEPEQTLRDYLGTPAGREFVEQLVQRHVLPRPEAARFVDRFGAVTDEGKGVIERMLYAAAIGDPEVAARAPKPIMRRLEHAIPPIVQVSRLPGWDLGPVLREALDLHAEMGAKGFKSITELLEQGALFGRRDTPAAITLAEFLDRVSAKAEVTATFRQYAELAGEATGARETVDMFGYVPPSPVETFQRLFANGKSARVKELEAAYISARMSHEEALAWKRGEPEMRERAAALWVSAGSLARATDGQIELPFTADPATRREWIVRARQPRVHVDVRGQVLTGPADYHRFLHPFRDPGIEQMHVIILDDADRILSHTMETSGAINFVTINNDFAWRIAHRAKRLKASRVVMSHNHPSGDPTASAEDVAVTGAVGAALEQRGIKLVGQYVIDDVTGTFIEHLGHRYSKQMIEVPRTTPGPDWTHPAGGRIHITNPREAIAELRSFGSSAASRDRFDVLYLDAQNRALALEPHRASALETMPRWLPQRLRMHGARDVILAVHDPTNDIFEGIIGHMRAAQQGAQEVLRAAARAKVGPGERIGMVERSIWGNVLDFINTANGRSAQEMHEPSLIGRYAGERDIPGARARRVFEQGERERAADKGALAPYSPLEPGWRRVQDVQEDLFGKPKLVSPEQRELLPEGAGVPTAKLRPGKITAEEIARVRREGAEPPGERPGELFEPKRKYVVEQGGPMAPAVLAAIRRYPDMVIAEIRREASKGRGMRGAEATEIRAVVERLTDAGLVTRTFDAEGNPHYRVTGERPGQVRERSGLYLPSQPGLNLRIETIESVRRLRELLDDWQAQEKDPARLRLIDRDRAALDAELARRKPRLAEGERPYDPTKEAEEAGIPQIPGDPNIDPVSRAQIVRGLSDALEVPIRTGKMRQRRALGIYKVKPEAIRLRVANDIETAAHEVGHHLHTLLFGSQAYTRRGALSSMVLKPWRDELKPLGAGVSDQSSAEGLAEFVRRYLTNPAAAKRRAPRFFDFFETTLREKHPDVLDLLTRKREEYALWLASSPRSRLRAHISIQEAPDHGSVRDRWTRFRTNVIDDMAWVERTVRDLTKGRPAEILEDAIMAARLARGSEGLALEFIDGKARDFKTLKPVGPSLRAVFKPVISRLDDFRDYAVALRAQELHGRGMETGLVPADVAAVLEELDSPLFRQTFADLQTWNRSLLQYLHDAGVISREALEGILENNKAYLPFYRVMDDIPKGQPSYTSQRFGHIYSPVKRIKGSGREIIDPFESLVKNAHLYVAIAQRQQVSKALAQLAKLRGAGWWIERVPAPLEKQAGVTAEQMLEAFNRRGAGVEFLDFLKEIGFVTGEGGKLEATSQMAEEILQVFRPGDWFGEPNMISVLEGGKRRWYQVHSELYEALMGIHNEELQTWVRWLSFPARTLRAGATLAPEFIGRNPVRDQIQAFIVSDYGFKPGLDFARGFWHMLRQTETYGLWRASGGERASLLGLDRSALRNTFKRRVAKQGIPNVVYNPLEMLRAASAAMEDATRVGEFARALKAEGGPGSKEAILRAGAASREVSVDFNRHGAKTAALRNLSAFWNARLQGYDRMFRAMKQHPYRTLGRVFMGITMPSIALYYVNRDDPDYWRLPQWQRDLFWCVKIGGHWLRIPKPFELGIVFGTIPERMLEWWDTRDPRRLSATLTDFALSEAKGVFLPIPNAIEPLIENLANYNLFTGRPLVPRGLEKVAPEAQVGPHTSELAEQLGRFLDYPPAKIDNLMYGWTGGVGRLASDIVTKGVSEVSDRRFGERPTSPLIDLPGPLDLREQTPFVRGFVAREPGASSEPVERFYEELARTSVAYETARHYERIEDPALDAWEDVHQEEIDRYEDLRPVADDIAGLRAEINLIRRDPDLSGDEKAEQIRQLEREMVQMAEDAIEFQTGARGRRGSAITRILGRAGDVLAGAGAGRVQPEE